MGPFSLDKHQVYNQKQKSLLEHKSQIEKSRQICGLVSEVVIFVL